jgi:predicted alpha/beta superfamily hydrolase
MMNARNDGLFSARWLLLGCLVFLNTASAQTGTFLPVEKVHSDVLDEDRTIRVWVPPSYDGEPEKRFPVLYLHDGQNTLSSAGPHVAFGWGNWEVDKSVERLVKEGRMKEIILVAIDNTRKRYQEYRGRAADYSDEEIGAMRWKLPDIGDNTAHENYARFLIEELKPHIDRMLRTKTGPADTGIMGSSMGGIASLVLAWDYPDVFGKAASISGAYQVEKEIFISDDLKTFTGNPKPIRVYLDSGVASSGGDDGRVETDAVATELRRIGWTDGENLMRYVDQPPLTAEPLEPYNLPADKFKEAQASQHNELYWRVRVWRALEFLFPVDPRK